MESGKYISQYLDGRDCIYREVTYSDATLARNNLIAAGIYKIP